MRVAPWRPHARDRDHPPPWPPQISPSGDSSHPLGLCSPFACHDRQRLGSCRKFAPNLSSHLPASRRPPHSPRWPRLWPCLNRSPLWSRLRPLPHCSRSKSPTAFSRALRATPKSVRVASPSCAATVRVAGASTPWSGVAVSCGRTCFLASASASACSTLLFHAVILAFSFALSLMPTAAGCFAVTQAGAGAAETGESVVRAPGRDRNSSAARGIATASARMTVDRSRQTSLPRSLAPKSAA